MLVPLTIFPAFDQAADVGQGHPLDPLGFPALSRWSDVDGTVYPEDVVAGGCGGRLLPVAAAAYGDLPAPCISDEPVSPLQEYTTPIVHYDCTRATGSGSDDAAPDGCRR
ncbi:hypothetical protein E1200_09715 [Actinomadura sp. GC306]|nr:hypothetical protein E1200_09715 [Actinomadura sp. GC306]